MENQVQSGPVAEGETPAQPQPELSVNDLLQVRAVVELAVRRGSFQANELSTVGAIYDRLNTFLNAVAPPAPKAEEPAANDQASAA
jgi:hypothetical protein